MFSGRMTYVTEFPGSMLESEGGEYTLDCGEVCETMEVWLNGKSLGVRIAAPYTVRFTGEDVRAGNNLLQMDVTNTLIHAMRDPLSMTMPVEPSGLPGSVGILGQRMTASSRK